VSATPTVLVLGYGNPGRLDDGMGPALAAELATRGLAGVRCEQAYQLQVEHAAMVAEHDAVVFADAELRCPGPFALRPLAPRAGQSFTTHHVTPGDVLALAHELYGRHVPGFVLGLRAHEVGGFGERLSARAQADLARAVDHMQGVLRDGSLLAQAAGSESTR
jgi:hydrogenase maturation protease